MQFIGMPSAAIVCIDKKEPVRRGQTGSLNRIFCYMVLLEVSYAALKDLLILVSGNVAADICADTLAVAHLSENASVGRCDALDSVNRCVGVEADIH